MKNATLTAVVVCLMLLGMACSTRDINNKEAVQKSISKYLADNSGTIGLDPSNMDIGVAAVAFEKDVARATISFTVKGTSTGMQMSYLLDRKGDEWVVRGKSQEGGGPHGMTALPGSGDANSPTLPVPLPGSQPQLPAGHPQIPSQVGSPK